MKTDDDAPLRVLGPEQQREVRTERYWRCLLPFIGRPGGQWQSTPQRPFRPRGLMIWGAPPQSFVRCYVGTGLEAVAAWGDVPARWFATAQSFEQLAAALDEGKEPPAWVNFNACDVGVLVTLEVYLGNKLLGPDDGVELVMWGETVRL